jgi:hypothetical protein
MMRLGVSFDNLVLRGLVGIVYALVAFMVMMLLAMSYIFWQIPGVGPFLGIAMIGLGFYWLDKVKYPPPLEEPILTWAEARARYSRPHNPEDAKPGSFDDLMPEPLYQAGCMMRKKQVCLTCGNAPATAILRKVGIADAEVVPICDSCTTDWNFYGYSILERVRPKELPWKVLKYKLQHWFSTQSIFRCYKDLKVFEAWGKRTKKIMKRLKKDD